MISLKSRIRRLGYFNLALAGLMVFSCVAGYRLVSDARVSYHRALTSLVAVDDIEVRVRDLTLASLNTQFSLKDSSPEERLVDIARVRKLAKEVQDLSLDLIGMRTSLSAMRDLGEKMSKLISSEVIPPLDEMGIAPGPFSEARSDLSLSKKSSKVIAQDFFKSDLPPILVSMDESILNAKNQAMKHAIDTTESFSNLIFMASIGLGFGFFSVVSLMGVTALGGARRIIKNLLQFLSQIGVTAKTGADISASLSKASSEISSSSDQGLVAIKQAQIRLSTITTDYNMTTDSSVVVRGIKESKSHAFAANEIMNRTGGSITKLELVESQLESISNQIQAIQNEMDPFVELSTQARVIAFNASIEAARAGVNGHGFATVAQQMATFSEKANHCVEEVQKTLSQAQVDVAKATHSAHDQTAMVRMNSKKCQTLLNAMVGSLGHSLGQLEKIELQDTLYRQEFGKMKELVNELQVIAQKGSLSSSALKDQIAVNQASSNALSVWVGHFREFIIGSAGKSQSFAPPDLSTELASSLAGTGSSSPRYGATLDEKVSTAGASGASLLRLEPKIAFEGRSMEPFMQDNPSMRNVSSSLVEEHGITSEDSQLSGEMTEILQSLEQELGSDAKSIEQLMSSRDEQMLAKENDPSEQNSKKAA